MADYECAICGKEFPESDYHFPLQRAAHHVEDKHPDEAGPGTVNSI